MNRLALVFAGGGGKGAYQIGAWKYLHEYGIDQYVTGVSGTSVGALNAALFASGTYETAEALWGTISPEQILQPALFTKETFSQHRAAYGVLSALKATSAYAQSELATLLADSFRQSFAFSREGLKELMDSGVDFTAIQTNAMPCFATCLSVPNFQLHRFDLRDYDKIDAETILLASSAIPIIFDAVNFKGTQYYDGGIPVVGDNVPIAPLYEQGANTIIVIHLSQEALIDRRKYPGATIIEIMPQVDLGNLVKGTLDFSPEGAQWRLEQGYQDTRRIFEPLIEQIFLSHKNIQLGESFKIQEKLFQEQHNHLQQEFRRIMTTMKSDGIAELLDQLKKERT